MPNIAVNVGYEIESWRMADRLSGSIAAVKHRRFALDLIFHHDISDAFKEQDFRLMAR